MSEHASHQPVRHFVVCTAAPVPCSVDSDPLAYAPLASVVSKSAAVPPPVSCSDVTIPPDTAPTATYYVLVPSGRQKQLNNVNKRLSRCCQHQLLYGNGILAKRNCFKDTIEGRGMRRNKNFFDNDARTRDVTKASEKLCETHQRDGKRWTERN